MPSLDYDPFSVQATGEYSPCVNTSSEDSYCIGTYGHYPNRKHSDRKDAGGIRANGKDVGGDKSRREEARCEYPSGESASNCEYPRRKLSGSKLSRGKFLRLHGIVKHIAYGT